MAFRNVSLVLSGGIALGAYEAGAYATLHERHDLRPARLAGSSIGSVNAAIIAGSPPDQRVQRLRAFWSEVALDPGPTDWLGFWPAGAWRYANSWLSVLNARLFGCIGVFQPRLPEVMLRHVTSLYDLSPLRAKLDRFIDFDRLNGGEVQVSVVTTDIETGEAVVFDTAQGYRIGSDHLLASCGFLPDFAPVEINGRLLGDGGLVANAPIEIALRDGAAEGDLLCFVVDLFSPYGGRPTTLEEAAARRWDLLFGNQSRRAFRSLEREYRLRSLLGALAAQLGPEQHSDPKLASALAEGMRRTVTLFHLSYRARPHEAGPEKAFDFSRASLEERWEAGSLDMAEAIRLAARTEPSPASVCVHQVRR